MLGFGLWWLARAEKAARRAGEGFGGPAPAAMSASDAAHDPVVRERATAAQSFDPAEAGHGQRSAQLPGILVAVLPLAVVMVVNLTMSTLVLPRMDLGFLAEPQWGGTSLAGVGGVWSVIVALSAAIVVLYALNRGRLQSLRDTVDAGLNAAALPVISVASLVGFGAVVAALPAFQVVSDWVLGIEGGPLVGLALSTNVLSALTGSASGGLTIALGVFVTIVLANRSGAIDTVVANDIWYGAEYRVAAGLWGDISAEEVEIRKQAMEEAAAALAAPRSRPAARAPAARKPRRP